MRRLLALLALSLLPPMLAAAPARASEGGGGSEEAGPTFVRFEPIIVSLFDDTRVAGWMSVTVTLQVPGAADKEPVESQRIRFIDAFNATLVQLGRLKVDPRRPLNIHMIAGELQKAADRTYGKHGLKVFVVDASARKI